MARGFRFFSRSPAASCAFVALLCAGVPYGWSQTNDAPSQRAGKQQPKSDTQPSNTRAQPPNTKPLPPAGGAPQTANNPPQAKDTPKPSDKQQQMRGLDEQIQEIKSDVLSISADLSRLEEKLIYPSGTQVAIFVALAKGDTMRLDAVRLQIDGQLAAQYVYSFKELDALRKGGVQRLYVGNVATGDHQIEIVVDGKRDNGEDFSRTEHLAFRKDVKPKLVELTLAGAANVPITLGEW